MAGRALAERYLMAGDLRLLVEGENRYEDKFEKGVVRRSAMERLLEGIAQGPGQKLELIEPGLRALAGASYSSFAHELQGFLTAVKLFDNEVMAGVEEEARGSLTEVGIGGSAVAGINPLAWPAWDRLTMTKAPLLKERLDALLAVAAGEG
jgi:hypothetical protein